MNRVLKYASLATRQLINHQRCSSNSKIAIPLRLLSTNAKAPTIHLILLSQFPRSFCSSGSNSGEGEDKTSSESERDVKDITSVPEGEVVQDSDNDLDLESSGEVVETKELVKELNAYLEGDGDNLEKVWDMVFSRAITGKHEDSDEEIMEKLRNAPLPDCKDSEFESDFDEAYSTDEELPHLYNAAEYTKEKLLEDGTGEEMNAEKFDEIMKEFAEYQKKENPDQVQKTMEVYVENMARKLLPEHIHREIEEKFNALCETCERGDVQPAEAYALFKEFEEKMVEEYATKLSPEEISHDTGSENKASYDKDPPGEGPILRWQTRVVLSPGGDAWHPKNRKVKVSIFVKELGLSKYAGKRLRALVGKRYNPGKDELTIVGERFEHREENRKDVLRILYALIDEAKQADKYVNEAYTAYTKERLKTSEHFQERLRAQVAMLRGAQGATVV